MLLKFQEIIFVSEPRHIQAKFFLYGLKDNLFKWFQFYNLDNQIGIKEK